MIQLPDADILALLRNGENSVVERKTVNDVDDVPRVLISFANSAPIGAPCVIFISGNKRLTYSSRIALTGFVRMARRAGR